MSGYTILWIVIIAFAVITNILNEKDKKEKVALSKSHNDVMFIMLRIIARVAFDYNRKIDIDNLSNREKIILCIILEFGKGFEINDKDDVDVLLRSFIEISNDPSIYKEVSMDRDMEALLERVGKEYAVLEYLFRVSMAVSVDENGDLIESKIERLKTLHKKLGIKYNIFDNNQGGYNSKDQDESINEYEKYYIILQCPTDASLDDIKKSYRKLSKEYHPDILSSKGLPEDMIKYSQERFNKITEAKDILTKKISDEEKKKEEDNVENNSYCKNESNDDFLVSKLISEGCHLIKLEQFNKAILYFDKVIKMNPNNSSCYYYRAVAYSKIKENKKAVDDLKVSSKLGYQKATDTLKKHNINFI